MSDTSDLNAVRRVLGSVRGLRMLDVATGPGHAALYFARLAAEVTATDVSAAMLEDTRRSARAAGVALQTTQHPAEHLPYPDAWFDLITCRMAAHHLVCAASFCMEASRVLRPGGHLVLIDATVEEHHPEAEAWLNEVRQHLDPTQKRLIRPLQWVHLCGHVGMRVLHREILPLKQPDLEWYFDTAATPEKNRTRVIELMESAPEEAVRLFRIKRDEAGHWTWWWQRLVMVAVLLDRSTDQTHEPN
ncbi:MAG: class I SAM-dependent methyltransferase [Candidatus Methylacidiphilales bacterium]